MSLKGKVVVITGASSGIGEGIVEKFIEEGANIVGCGLEETMKFSGENCLYVQGDLRNYEVAEKVIETAVNKFNKIDYLINCAGVTGKGDLETTTVAEFQRQFEINVFAVFNICKAAIKELKKSEKSSIINIASDLGVKAIPDRIAYCPTKASVLMMTKCMALDYGPDIRVNAIMPGLVETPMIKDRIENAEDPKEFKNNMAEMYTLKRLGTTQDIAEAAVFLASDKSSFITGDALAVCGGGQI